MVRRDVLKCLIMLPFGLVLDTKSKEQRITVTIIDHSDEKPFVVMIEGDESSLLILRHELRTSGSFRYSAEMFSKTLFYRVDNSVFSDVFLDVFERYDNIDYKVIWYDKVAPPTLRSKAEDVIDKRDIERSWMVTPSR